MASVPSRAETRQFDKQLQGILTPFTEAFRCRRHKRPGPRSNASRRPAPALARRARAAQDDRAVRLPKPPWIIAHRGAEPQLENTIPALLLAIDEGADLLEFDVQATADDVLVLHHDADLARLAGRPDLVVESATLRELPALELRHPERPALTGRIPTLAELLAALPGDFPVNIELKRDATDRGRLAELALAATAERDNVLFSSFDAALLRELRRRSPSARIAPLASRWTPALERLAAELEAWSLHVSAADFEVAEDGRARCREPRGAAAPRLHRERRRARPGAPRGGRCRPLHRPSGRPPG